jgi:hypothetical protein
METIDVEVTDRLWNLQNPKKKTNHSLSGTHYLKEESKGKNRIGCHRGW